MSGADTEMQRRDVSFSQQASGWAESTFRKSFQRQSNEISYWGFTSYKSPECPLGSLGADSEYVTMDMSEGLNLIFNLLLILSLSLLLLPKGWSSFH